MPIRSTQTRGYEFPQLWNIEDCGNEVDAKILEWGDPQPHHEKNGGPTKGRVPWFISQKGIYVEDEREATVTTPEKNELRS